MSRRGGRRAQPVDPARWAAYQVLAGVRRDDAYANLLLAGRLRAHRLEARDAAFATELVSGTLRRLGTYDAVLTACADRPLDRLDPEVVDSLRLGVHQLLAMRVPSHAAVSTTVDLVRAAAGPGPAGLANAVLRRVAEHDLDGWVRRVAPDPVADPVGFDAVASGHPRFVVEELGAALAASPGTSLGERSAELGDLLAADNAPAAVTLAVRPGLATLDELAAWGCVPTGLAPTAAVLTAGDPARIPAVAAGRAAAQDEGSQLVALALAAAPLDGPDRRWLDLCAGPGGKAALLGALAARRGARLLAGDRHRHRAALVVSAARALPPGAARVVVADGTRPPWRPGAFDRVLLDAPCTGFGALRRRPEARWRRTPADLYDLVALQRMLLRSALVSTRPGGLVGYATCSPVLRETVGVVSQVLDEDPAAQLVDATSLFPTTDHDGPLPGTVQLWPHRHGTDAMFFALLRKRANPEDIPAVPAPSSR
jgi:16S rRNA (cytosine967-C5)-methyltransferase